jgi:uncharacterized membrane protein YjfL (UPF0719 family)
MLMSLLNFGFIVKIDQLLEVLVTTLIFVVIGLIIFGIAFFILEKVTPFSIRKEIEDDQNTALGIVIGSMLIGIAIIIAAAIQG